MPAREHARRRAEFTDKYGVDPIAAGIVGKLADHECRHGFLPTDRKRSCSCWPKPKRGKR